MAKLPRRWSHAVFSVIMAAAVSGITSFVNTAIHNGFAPDFLFRWLKSYGIGFFVAAPSIYLLAPLARRWSESIVLGNARDMIAFSSERQDDVEKKPEIGTH